MHGAGELADQQRELVLRSQRGQPDLLSPDGTGIVEPVDDVRDSNPPASEELLDALAKDLTTHNYDAKHLIRLVMTSRVYQLASGDPGPIGEKYFTHAVVRFLPAEPLLDALSAATDVPETFGEADRRNADVGQKVVDPNEAPPTFGAMPVGTRATQLPDGDVYQHPFLSAFGQPARETSCECERTSDAGLVHALQLINGPSVKDKLTRRDNRIGKLLAADRPDTELLDELYLATVGGSPRTRNARRPSCSRQDQALGAAPGLGRRAVGTPELQGIPVPTLRHSALFQPEPPCRPLRLPRTITGRRRRDRIPGHWSTR